MTQLDLGFVGELTRLGVTQENRNDKQTKLSECTRVHTPSQQIRARILHNMQGKLHLHRTAAVLATLVNTSRLGEMDNLIFNLLNTVHRLDPKIH